MDCWENGSHEAFFLPKLTIHANGNIMIHISPYVGIFCYIRFLSFCKIHMYRTFNKYMEAREGEVGKEENEINEKQR